ncbi:MAG: PC4/YdbC family ssDNA-binding protein [Clostridia bacterium]|nr:PC4/YdbC family ssDNA-binding protein [Clostridia bacterium]
MKELEFEIVKHIGVISENTSGWQKQLNVISWNKATPKFDIRDWSPDGTKCGKGITFNDEEGQILLDLLKGEFTV